MLSYTGELINKQQNCVQESTGEDYSYTLGYYFLHDCLMHIFKDHQFSLRNFFSFEMIFIDDEERYINEIGSFGVISVLVKNGITLKMIEGTLS